MNNIVLRFTAFLIILFSFASCNPLEKSPSGTDTPDAETLETQVASKVNTSTLVAQKTILPTETETPEPTAALYGPYFFPKGINPLTGTEVESLEVLDRRPVMVKVSNYPATGRPHAGLSDADIVFEYYIGEGTNRFLALYYGKNAAAVGPVRSGRLVDPKLTNLYQGILAYASADISVNSVIWNALGNRAITLRDFTCPALCYVGQASVLNAFADTQKLSDYAQKNGIDNTPPKFKGMIFEDRAPAFGDMAKKITVDYNPYDIGQWRYDAEKKGYLRWIEEVDQENQVSLVPLVDRNNDQQLLFSNVIIVFAQYTEYASTLHDIELYDNNQGSPAIIFRDEKAIQGIWKTTDNRSPIQFFTEDDVPMALKPGNTWIVFMGLATESEEPLPGEWKFHFKLP